jgi:hypothetical protein
MEFTVYARVRAFVICVVIATAVGLQPTTVASQTAGNARCITEDVFFSPSNGEDIIVPPGYKVEVFVRGLNFPAGIAFKGNKDNFEVYVTEAGTSLPGICNAAVGYPSSDGSNPFLPQVSVWGENGNFLRRLGRPDTVANRENAEFLHAPTIGVTFEHGFDGGLLLVTDSRQGIRGAQGPRNSSRIVTLDPLTGLLEQLIVNLPTGDHPTEQITVKDGLIFWSQGSATNSGVVGHDNTGGPGGGPDIAEVFQREIPCEDVVLSGNNVDSGDGHITGGFLPHGIPGSPGQVVPAFAGADQPGMCTGAILAANLANPQDTVRPVSWGYRNPFGIRFAPVTHPLHGALLVTENGEDERGARPVNNAPDRLQVTEALQNANQGELDFHGWPDRFGFLNSTQAIFNPIGGPADDNAPAVTGKPVLPLLRLPPQPPIAPLALEPADVAAVGLDFVPLAFAGGGNPGELVERGDALVTREGDFGFSPANGDPIEGHDIELVRLLNDGRIVLERFAYNCKAENQVIENGRKRCTQPENQAFVARIRGINRPVDGKFGPDGAFYLVDFGAVRDFGRATPESSFVTEADNPLVQIPGTGVIWKISRD